MKEFERFVCTSTLLFFFFSCVSYSQESIHELAPKGDVERLELLILKGADINKTDELGDTALEIAANFQHTDFIKKLLEHNAVITERAMREAVTSSNIEIVKLFVEHGATLAYQQSNRGNALHDTNNIELLTFLLDNGVFVDCQDRFGKTKLIYAVGRDHNVVDLLLSRNANIYLKDKEGNSAFTIAQDFGGRAADLIKLKHKEITQQSITAQP